MTCTILAQKIPRHCIVNVGNSFYDFCMNTMIVKAIRQLVKCGIPASDAVVACEDFVSRFGKQDLNAFVRCLEVWHVDTI